MNGADGNNELDARNAEDLLSRFAAPVVTAIESRAVRDQFLPWHKPRKHYVRIHQWCKAVQDLIDNGDVRLKGTGRSLSYLGLPGDDMLDIRSLHRVCELSGVKLRYLGFNDALKLDPFNGQISNNELSLQGYPNVDSQASVLRADSLAALGQPDSPAREALDSHAPYDVVNLDLCGSITEEPPGVTESTMQALREILHVQRVRQAEPWLLFLTTRANRDRLHSGAWSGLLGKIAANEAASSDFRTRFREYVGIGDGEALTDAFSMSGNSLSVAPMRESDDTGLRRTVIVGFCKWLINIAVKGEPSWQVDLIDAKAYSVYSGLDMYSLVLKFTTRVREPRDDSGWTNDPLFRGMSDHNVTESHLACRLLDSLAELCDIDGLLRGDQNLWNATVTAASEMMEAARYDRNAYLAWVGDGYPKHSGGPGSPRRRGSRRRSALPR